MGEKGGREGEKGTHDHVPGVLVPADVRAVEDEGALVLGVRGVDGLEAADDLGLLLVCGWERGEGGVVLECGP